MAPIDYGEGCVYLLQVNPAEKFLLGCLVEPFLLLINQLRQFVAVDPILLDDLRRVHLVVESVMLSLAVQAARAVVSPILTGVMVKPVDLVRHMLLLRVDNSTGLCLVGCSRCPTHRRGHLF